jgi:Carboxypeptidase regulatory-like domain
MLSFISKCSGRLTTVATVAILAGCGVSMNAAVIGVPPTVAPGVVLSSTDPAIGAYQRALVDELNQAVSTQGAHEAQQLQAQFEALTNNHTLIGAEKIDALRQFGAQQIALRQTVVSQLIADVQSRQHLSSGQRSALIANLQAVSAHLTSLGNLIAQDTLVDRLRTDVVSMANSTRIYGLVLPVVYLADAADSMIAEASLLAQRGQQIYGTILQNGAGDPNHGLEVAAYQSLQTQIGTLDATANSGVNAVLSLSASDYTTATSVINGERSLMSSVLGPFGPMTTAQTFVSELRGWSTWKPSAAAAAAPLAPAPLAALPVFLWGTPAPTPVAPPAAPLPTLAPAAAPTPVPPTLVPPTPVPPTPVPPTPVPPTPVPPTPVPPTPVPPTPTPATGTLSGTVADSSTQGAIQGASVTYTGVADNSTYTVTTDVNGYYFFGPMLAEDYTVTVTATNYGSQTTSATVPAGGNAPLTFSLTANTPPSPSPT